MLNSGLSLVALIWKETTTDETCMVFMHKRVPTNWVSGRTMPPSTEPVIASFFVTSDFVVEGHVGGQGTLYPFSLQASLHMLSSY